jgi:hypothetical protein
MVIASALDSIVALLGVNVTINLYELGVDASGRTNVSDVLKTILQLAKFVPVPSAPYVALQLVPWKSVPVTVTVEPKYAVVGAKLVRAGKQCASCVNSSAATKTSKLRGIEPRAGNRVIQ